MENESLTDGSVVDSGLDNQPTTETTVQTSADATHQETISNGQPNEAVSDDSTATVTTNSGAEETDEGLVKFAKGQGISDEDYATLSEREIKLLKVAKDNQTAARNKPADRSLTDANNDLVDAPKANESEDESFKREFRQYKYERQADQFWSSDKHDRTLESGMVGLLNKKIEELTPSLGEAEARKYAFNLSRDLPTLYNLAAIEAGTFDPQAARQEGRREERDSIRRQSAASAPEAHATASAPASSKIDLAWVQDTYDSNNAEHRILLDEAMARGDLY